MDNQNYEQPQQPVQPQQPMYAAPVAAQVPGKGLAIASLVLGLAGLLVAAVICGTVAIVLSIVAKKQGYKGGMATAGLVLGIIDVAVWLISIIFLQSFLSKFGLSLF